MEKYIDKITFKITWDSIKEATLLVKSIKHTKTIKELIELHRKECLMIVAEKLSEKKEEIKFNKQIITITLMKKKVICSSMIGEKKMNN